MEFKGQESAYQYQDSSRTLKMHDIFNSMAGKKGKIVHDNDFCSNIWISCSVCRIQEGRYCIPISRSLTNLKMHDIFNSMAGKEI